jgi:cytochrome P450
MTHSRPADFRVPETEDFDSPHALFAELRRRCPVAWSPDLGGFWAATRHADILRVLTDWQAFTTTVQNVVPPVATTQRRPPLHLDPPDNIPYRRAIQRFLTPARLADWRRRIEAMVAAELDPFLAAGGGDICAEFGFRLPISLLAEFFRLDPDEAARIRIVGAEFNMALQHQDLERLRERSDALYAIAARLIADRQAKPRDPDDDPVASLLATRVAGEPLPPPMILGALRQFLLVGIIAPTTFIGSLAVHLARHPEHHAQLSADPALVPAALEELLRLYTPYRGFARTARFDVTLGGRTIRAGEVVAAVFTSGNRDETVFPDPDSFRLDRPTEDLLTFGRGPHMCPGAPLARLLLAEVLRQLATKTRRLVLTGPVEMTRWPEYGPLRVPLRVHCGPRGEPDAVV